jgi:hypothetical protein
VQRTVYGFPVRGGADGKLRKKIRGELYHFGLRGAKGTKKQRNEERRGKRFSKIPAGRRSVTAFSKCRRSRLWRLA